MTYIAGKNEDVAYTFNFFIASNCYHLRFVAKQLGLLHPFLEDGFQKLSRGLYISTVMFIDLHTLTGWNKSVQN